MAIKLFGGRLTIGRGKSISAGVGQSDDDFAFSASQRWGTDYKSRNRLEAYKNVVYDCVSLIGEACGDYKPVIYRQKGDQPEFVNDHELLQLLKRPGGQDLTQQSFSQFDLFEATVSYMLLQGDAFWYLDLGLDSGRPRSITLLRPDKVGTDVDPKTGIITGYYIRRANGDPIPMEVNEVLRFPLFDPTDPYKGMGAVEANDAYIGTDESTATFTKNFFNNNAGLSGVLNIKGEVSKGAFRKFVRGWRSKYEGVDNAGKVAIVRDSEAAFTKIGLGLNELNMAELRKMTLDDVLMGFKVPLPLLGKADQTGLGRANVEALEYIFSKYNIDKKMKRFDAVLDFALERYYGDADLTVSHENIIPEDKEFELQERNLLTDKVYTRNEIRDEEGLDSVDGGDQLFVPMASIPLNSDLNNPVVTSPASAKAIKIVLRRQIVDSKKKVVKSLAKENFRLKLQRNQLLYERHYLKALKPIIVDQLAEALHNLEAHGGSLGKGIGGKLFDDAAADLLMTEVLTPVLTNLTEQQGALALLFAGDAENDFKVTSSILALLSTSTMRMAGNFNDQTLDSLNNTLAEGIQAGESLGKLKNRVQDVYRNISDVRSMRVARTETLKASNNASELAYKQTGFVTAKEWYVNPDACDICTPFDGKVIGLGEVFAKQGTSVSYTDSNGDDQEYQVDYADVENPPLHPNCRCTIVPVS